MPISLRRGIKQKEKRLRAKTDRVRHFKWNQKFSKMFSLKASILYICVQFGFRQIFILVNMPHKSLSIVRLLL